MNREKTYCGYIAIFGRSNVGKSTLLNKLIGKKISITSHRPNTTRSYIFGVHTEEKNQSIYIDTPGLWVKKKQTFFSHMNQKKDRLVSNVDLIIFVVDAFNWIKEDKILLDRLRIIRKVPIILVVNKVDKIKEKKNYFLI